MAKRKKRRTHYKRGKYGTNIYGLTPNQAEWVQQVARIRKEQSALRRQGFTWSEDIIGERPKVIRQKHIAELKAIKPKQLKGMGFKLPPKPQPLPTPEPPKPEQVARANGMPIVSIPSDEFDSYYYDEEDLFTTSAVDDMVLANLEEEIERWRPQDYWSAWTQDRMTQHVSKTQSLVELAVAEYGRENVAANVQKHATEVREALDAILYAPSSDDSTIQFNISRLVSIMKGSALTMTESQRLMEQTEVF